MPRDRIHPRRTATLLIWVGLITPLVLYVLSFWREISATLGYFWDWFLFMFGFPPPVMTAALSRNLQVTFFTLFAGFALIFFLWLLLTSFQAILPVEDEVEVAQTMAHQLFYILGMHGQAVLVKDGKQLASTEEVHRVGPGVVVVDFNSAVVLERLVGPPTSIIRPLVDLVRRMAHVTGVSKHYAAPTVHGPGLIFTLPYERIRGAVDLRRQTRRLTDVNAYTRDGIELKSNVFAVFSIGQLPDILQVAYVGARRVENLRVVTTELVNDGKQVRVRIVGDEEVDPDDLQEMHDYARIPNRGNDSTVFAPLPPFDNQPVFDEHRVFAAVFAQARDQAQDQLLPWTDLPARVALDVFRETLSRINYDDLYGLNNPNPASFPLPRVRKMFRARVRNTGALSFRVVFLRSGKPLSNDEDSNVYNVEDLLCTAVRPLTAQRMLRERGIKIITSGFSNPMPSAEILQQRLASWKTRWEQEREVIIASRELDAARIRNRARAQAQREMTSTLGKLLEHGEMTDEALAIRVLQALEAAAADAKTREMLPADTIKLMEHIHKWLFEESKGGARGGTSQPPAAQPQAEVTPPPENAPAAEEGGQDG